MASPVASARAGVAGRIALVLVALPQAEIGIWGLVAPHSFYRSFPGGGRHWVSVLGAYNEHLVRDYAAAELGFGLLLLIAAIQFGRTLVLAAGAAFLAATLPHFAYHLTTTEHLSTGDNVGSLGGFAFELILAVAAMGIAASRPRSDG